MLDLPRPLYFSVKTYILREDLPGLSGKRTRANSRHLLWQNASDRANIVFHCLFAEIAGLLGRWMVNVLPFPSSDSTVTSPPCSSARCLTMASPSPVPPISRE